jgi:hypothetical protein
VEAGKRAVVEGRHVGFPLCAFGAWTGTAFILEGVERAVFVGAVRGAVTVETVPATQDEILDKHSGLDDYEERISD